MKYAVKDSVSNYYVSKDPAPGILWLLRESVRDATSFETRGAALEAQDAAAAYFEGRYRDVELEVKPMTQRKQAAIARIEDSAASLWPKSKKVDRYAGDFLTRTLSGDDGVES